MSRGSPASGYTLEEQETIIRWDQASDTAHIGTMSQPLIRQLGRREIEPETVECDAGGKIIAATYTVPRKWIKVSPPRRVSDQERERLAEMGRQKAR